MNKIYPCIAGRIKKVYNKGMATKIFVMTHKEFERPKDKMYVPLQVGHALTGTLNESYLTDDAGEDNISAENPYFSELTGIYWVWKNYCGADNVGICHYRRYPVMREVPEEDDTAAADMAVNLQRKYRERLLTEQDCERILKEYDLITTEQLILHSNYYEGFAIDHNLHDLQATQEVIREKYPSYYDCFCELVHKNRVYFGNICVMPKPLFDSYCSWLFDILFTVQKRIDVSGYDGYRKRVFGFLSEFLQMVWIRVNGLRPYECRIAIIGEKFETREVKNAIAEFFRKKDVQGAKAYFLDCFQKRPDILMEASDITGELRICMQIVSTCEFEQRFLGSCILDKVNDVSVLISLFRKLNMAVLRRETGEETEEDRVFLKSEFISEPAKEVAAQLVSIKK